MTEFLYKELTYKLQGCFFSVYNALGFGHKETVYQKAPEIELKKNQIVFEPQKILNIYYNKERVGNYRPDLVIDNKIIVEIKAVDFVPKDYEKQLLYYLKGTEYKLGYLVNFGNPKLYIKRFIWTP